MKTYDEFLTSVAEYHYNQWMMDNDGTKVGWGSLDRPIINFASAVYGHRYVDIYQSFRKRLDELYGNPLTRKSGTRKTWD